MDINFIEMEQSLRKQLKEDQKQTMNTIQSLLNPEKLMEYLKASLPNITQEKPQAEDDIFETKLQERTLQENIDLITKIGTYSWTEDSVSPSKDFDHYADILILCFVRGTDRESRNFIREILGKLNQMENVEYKFQILFVFGQSYMSKDAAKNLTKEWQLENKEHHDLIIAETEDSYNTVIIKEINAFNWVLKAYENSSKLKWIMKMDDDVLLNIPELKTVLKTHEEDLDKEAIICRVIRATPVRKPNSKWYTPWYLYPEIKYPHYCYGPMYILSVPAIRTLTKLFEQDFQHFLWLEDVYLTGILAQKGTIQKFDNKLRFLRTFPYLWKENPKDFIGIHMSGVKLEKRRMIWKSWFGTKWSQNDDQMKLQTNDLKPSKDQIELESRIISNQNATTKMPT